MASTHPFSSVDLDDREILKREAHYQRFACCLRHRREGGPPEVTEEMSTFSYIAGFDKTAKQIAASDQPLFFHASNLFKGWHYSLTPLGSRLWLQIRAFLPMIEEVYANQTFSPHVAVLLKACTRWQELFLYYRIYDSLDLGAPEVRVALDRIAAFIRRVCRSARFKRVVSNYRRASAKNFQSCCEYMAELFKCNSQLLIVRVDLYYLPEAGAWADIEAADSCHDQFLRALREGKILDQKGYISKRNDGYRRGMHYQLIVAMDGEKYRDARLFSQLLGNHWITHCTRGSKLGSFFSCYSKNEVHRFNYIGLVHASDHRAMAELGIALRHITLGDHQLKTSDGRDRNLRRGIKPRPAIDQRRHANGLHRSGVCSPMLT